MKDLKFRAWHVNEKRMYYRGYQKFLHILLCENDHGANDGKGFPVKRVGYGECFLLESTGLEDRNHKEIFEGDVVKVTYKEQNFTGLVGSVPDMFGSRKLHPLDSLLKKHGIKGSPENLLIEILGNEYESPELAELCQEK